MRLRNPEKQQRILDAAVKVFARRGFFQAKVSEIAREAGVADGTVYLYFKSKDDLLISIFEVKMREAIQRFREEVQKESDGPSRLWRLVQLHLGVFQADPDLAAVFQVELRQSYRFMREYAKGELREYVDLIGEVVERGQLEGAFRDDLPVGLMKRFIFGALDEIVSTWVMSGMKYDLKASAAPLVDLFFHGITHGPSPSHADGASESSTQSGGSHEVPGG